MLDTVEELNLLDSTLVLFTSDNGFLMGEHGLIDKRCTYEESVRVPLIAHCLELILKGTHTDRIALNINVAPTVLEIAGREIPDSVQGSSLLTFVRGENPRWRTAMLYDYFGEVSPNANGFPRPDREIQVRTLPWRLRLGRTIGLRKRPVRDAQLDR